MDAETQYPSDGFPAFTSSVTSCPIQYFLESVIPDETGKSLSVLSLDSTTRLLTISSQNSNQIGIYTVTIKGEITCYPSIFASTVFTIQVLDPCLTTTLN